MDVNLRGAVFLSQEVAKAMLGAEDALNPMIVFITSASTELVSIDRAQYCVSKARALDVGEGARGQAGAGRHSGLRGPARRDPHGYDRGRRQIRCPHRARVDPGRALGRRRGCRACVVGLSSGHFGYATGTVINADGGLLIPRL
jgi:3-oxoacyl-[acyl-carrier protein] reductase